MTLTEYQRRLIGLHLFYFTDTYEPVFAGKILNVHDITNSAGQLILTTEACLVELSEDAVYCLTTGSFVRDEDKDELNIWFIWECIQGKLDSLVCAH